MSPERVQKEGSTWRTSVRGTETARWEGPLTWRRQWTPYCVWDPHIPGSWFSGVGIEHSSVIILKGCEGVCGLSYPTGVLVGPSMSGWGLVLAHTVY